MVMRQQVPNLDNSVKTVEYNKFWETYDCSCAGDQAFCDSLRSHALPPPLWSTTFLVQENGLPKHKDMSDLQKY